MSNPASIEFKMSVLSDFILLCLKFRHLTRLYGKKHLKFFNLNGRRLTL